MDPISFTSCAPTDFKVDVKNSPLARTKQALTQVHSHWEVADSKVSLEIFFHILECLPLKDQVNATLVSRLFNAFIKGLYPLIKRTDLFGALQKFSWTECAYAKFRGAYLTAISSVIDMNSHFSQTLEGYIVSKGPINKIDYRKLSYVDCLWYREDYSKESKLLNTSKKAPWISVITTEDGITISLKEGGGVMRLFPFKHDFVQWPYADVFLFHNDSDGAILHAFKNNKCEVVRNKELSNTLIWSNRPAEAVCIQRLPGDRLLFIGETGEGSIWKMFPDCTLIKRIQVPEFYPFKGAAVIQRNKLEVLIFRSRALTSVTGEFTNCALYDLETLTLLREFQGDFPVVCYHLVGKNLLWLGYENSQVKLWDLRKEKCLLSITLQSMPLDFRYDPKLSTLYIACEKDLLNIPINGLSELDA